MGMYVYLHASTLTLCFNSYNVPLSSHLAAFSKSGFHKKSSILSRGTLTKNTLKQKIQ